MPLKKCNKSYRGNFSNFSTCSACTAIAIRAYNPLTSIIVSVIREPMPVLLLSYVSARCESWESNARGFVEMHGLAPVGLLDARMARRPIYEAIMV